MKDYFEGTINGVTYTDEKAFNEAVSNLEANKPYSVSYRKGSTDTRVADLSELTGFVNDIRSMFGCAPIAQEAVAKVAGMLGFDYGRNPEHEPEQKVAAEKTPSRVDIESYCFPYTTYQFRGDEEDERQLDRFSSLLKHRIDEWKATGRLTKAAIAKFTQKEKTFTGHLTDIRERKQDATTAISSCQRLGIATCDLERRLAAIENEENYCTMMVDYYHTLRTMK